MTQRDESDLEVLVSLPVGGSRSRALRLTAKLLSIKGIESVCIIGRWPFYRIVVYRRRP